MFSQKTEKIVSDIAEMRKVDADLAKTFVDKVKDLVGKMLNVFKKNKFESNPETEEGKFFAKWSEFGDELSGIFAEAAADAADQAALAARRTDTVSENKKPADDAAGVKNSLRQFEDGTRFVDVKTDQHLFDGLSLAEKTTLARNIIKQRFSGRVIGGENPVFVNGESAKEYSHPARNISDDIRDAKMRSATELDNLIAAGENLRTEPDGKDGHTHPGVKNFSYLNVIFKVGNDYYSGIVNIENNNRGKRLKDITKIKNITEDIISSYGNNPKSEFLRDVSIDSIYDSSEKSNPSNEKNSLRNISSRQLIVQAIRDHVEGQRENAIYGQFLKCADELEVKQYQTEELRRQIDKQIKRGNKPRAGMLRGQLRDLKEEIAQLEDQLDGLEQTQEIQDLKRTLTKENTPAAARVKNSLRGYANNGRGMYEGNFPKGTPKFAKAEVILRYIQDVWSKKPIRLVVNDGEKERTIYAKFDPTYDEGGKRSDASKLMGGNRHGSSAEQRVTLDLADDYYQILSNARYNYTKTETGKESVTHQGVLQWHYFINDIYFAEHGTDEYLPYRVSVNVKEKADGNFVYSFSAEKQNGVSPQQTLHAAVSGKDAAKRNSVSIDSISNPAEKINPSGKKSSQRTLTKENTPAAARVKNSIRRTTDGIKYVKLDGNIFVRPDGTEMTKREAYNALVGKTITLEDGDKITFIKNLPGGRSVYNELFNKRPGYDPGIDVVAVSDKINRNIVETLKASTMKTPNEMQRHPHVGVVDFDLREVYLADDNKAYRLELNIANLTDGTKIAYVKRYVENASTEANKKIRMAETARQSPLNRPSDETSKNDVFISSIRQGGQKSQEETEKNSRRNINERQIIVDMLKSLPYEVEHNQYFQEYLDKIESLDRKQAQLDELTSKWRELMFQPGKRSEKTKARLTEIRTQTAALNQEIVEMDRRLLYLAEFHPFRNIVCNAEKRQKTVA